MSVHKKLMQARVNLQACKLTKSGNNKFAGYSYFELGDFLPQTVQIFNQLGLCGVIRYGQTETTLTITDTEDNTELIVTSPMSEANLKGCHPVQNLGAVETYIRRYLWVTAMEIVEHDALDATVGNTTPSEFDATPFLLALKAAETVEDLASEFKVALQAAQKVKDEQAMKDIIRVKDVRKAELQKVA